MAPEVSQRDLNALTMGGQLRLQDLVDRSALGELARSLQRLSKVSVRVLSSDGALLADASSDHELCKCLNGFSPGKAACLKTIDGAKRLVPEGAAQAVPCFSGARYHVVPLSYDRRPIGRVVLGPFVPAPHEGPSQPLFDLLPQLERSRAEALLAAMPRLTDDELSQLSTHVQTALDLIVFAGHKALLTSQMHLATVTEHYRDLEEKNRRLQEAVDRLRELDRLKSNFLATVSHELRTPLTSIIGYSEMLSEGIAGELSGEQREFVATIHEKGQQLLQLIMNLLDISKLESGTMSIKRRAIKIGDVLRQVTSTLLPAARRKGVILEAHAPDDLPEIDADPERLRQVFLNLTENAIKFTPITGSVTLTASAVTSSGDDDDSAGFVLMAPEETHLEVRVADTGIGIPEAERGKVFDAFYQVDSSSTREFGGTGLGLSIVKRLVEAHNGTIRIEGNQPKGTVFVVSLPLPT